MPAGFSGIFGSQCAFYWYASGTGPYTQVSRVAWSAIVGNNLQYISSFGDVTNSSETDKGDASIRGTNIARAQTGQVMPKIEGQLKWTNTNSLIQDFIQELYSVHQTPGATLSALSLDAPYQGGGQGWWADWCVPTLSRKEPLKSLVTIDFTLEIAPDADTAVPAEYVIITSA